MLLLDVLTKVLVVARLEGRDPVELLGGQLLLRVSRNPGAANTITLIGPRGKILVRRTVGSNDWSHTWGYFEATLDLPSFSGRGKLRVGTGSARDGTFEGVEIPVRMGR